MRKCRLHTKPDEIIIHGFGGFHQEENDGARVEWVLKGNDNAVAFDAEFNEAKEQAVIHSLKMDEDRRLDNAEHDKYMDKLRFQMRLRLFIEDVVLWIMTGIVVATFVSFCYWLGAIGFAVFCIATIMFFIYIATL